jgi:hypothetical protein
VSRCLRASAVRTSAISFRSDSIAALDDHQTETGAWTIIDIVPPMESIKEPLEVCLHLNSERQAEEDVHAMAPED